MSKSRAGSGTWNDSRGPFARREALHPGANTGIDEVPLGDVARIRLRDDEGEHGVGAFQDLRQLGCVLVTCLDPCYAWPGLLGGNVLFMYVST